MFTQMLRVVSGEVGSAFKSSLSYSNGDVFLLYVYECFTCIHICATYTFPAPAEHQTLKTEFQIVVSGHMGAGNHTRSFVRAAGTLDPELTPQPRQPWFGSEVRF